MGLAKCDGAPYPLVHIARMFAHQNELDRAVEILAILHKHPLPFGQTDRRPGTSARTTQQN